MWFGSRVLENCFVRTINQRKYLTRDGILGTLWCWMARGKGSWFGFGLRNRCVVNGLTVQFSLGSFFA